MPDIVTSAADWSWARPSPTECMRKGYTIALRYVGNPNNDGRVIVPSERDSIYAAGMRLGTIAQFGAVDDPRGGYERGRVRGNQAAYGLGLVDFPRNKPVLLACGDVGDPDGSGPKPGFPQQFDFPVIKDFIRGFKDTCPWPIGVYGPYWLIEALANDPIATGIVCYWQTAGGSGNGAGTGGSAYNPGDGTWRRLSIHACFYQQYGGETVPATDHNQVYGHHDYHNFTYHPGDGKPKPPEQDEEESMITHIWLSSAKNRDWLESIGYQLPQSIVDDGGWNSVWAGLGAWETGEDPAGDIKFLTAENRDLLNAVAYIQAVNNQPVTIVEDGFMDSNWFRAKVVKSYVKENGPLLPDELSGKA